MNYLKLAKQNLIQIKAKPRRSLGQNFMVDARVLDYLGKLFKEERPNAILEIGPGLGFLTDQLIDLEIPTLCIEKDKKYSQFLKEKYNPYPNIQVVEHDILEYKFAPKNFSNPMDLKSKKNSSTNSVLCIGNIPYQISSPLLDWLEYYQEFWSNIYLVTQKEFANRLCAKPGSRDVGAITLWMQLNANIKKIKFIPASSFYPKPQVDSALIRIDFLPRKIFNPLDAEWIKKCIHLAFMKRRKYLVNTLMNTALGLEKETVVRCIEKSGLDLKARPENVLLEEWVTLGKNIREECE